MNGAVEAMQRLIAEADVRFEEKFQRCCKGEFTNMNVYIDRVFDLRSASSSVPLLMNDQRFCDMLATVEQRVVPEYVAGGEPERSASALLAGLLKTLLREVLPIESITMRKILVDMIAAWHSSKEREVLDFTLTRLFPEKSEHESSPVPISPEASKTSKPSPLAASSAPLPVTSRATAVGAAASATSKEHIEEFYRTHEFVGLTPENLKKNAINNKFSLFRSRNLLVGEGWRRAALGLPANGEYPVPKVVMGSSAQKHQRKLRMQQLSSFCNGFSGPPVLLYQHSEGARLRHNVVPRPPPVTERERDDEFVAAVQSKICQHAAQQVEEAYNHRERVDALAMLAYNQARQTEETVRRIEAAKIGCERPATSQPAAKGISAVGFYVSEHVLNPLARAEVQSARERKCVPVHKIKKSSEYPMRAFLSPDLNNCTARGGGPPLAELDVYLDPLCVITHPTPRLDVPIKEQLLCPSFQPLKQKLTHSSTQPENTTDVLSSGPVSGFASPNLHSSFATPSAVELALPSKRQAEQLRDAARLRLSYAGSALRGAHFTFLDAIRYEVVPADCSYEECLSELPRGGDWFPRNPAFL